MISILRELRALGIQLRASDGQLKIRAPAGVLTDDLKERIRIHKAQLLESLEGPPEVAHRCSFIQRRMWLLEALDQGGTAYNVPIVMQVPGAVELPALRRALNRLVARHSILRTRYEVHQGEPYQIVESDCEVPLVVVDCTDLLEARIRLSQFAEQKIDLGRAPILTCVVARLPGDHTAVLALTHHICCDGWSIQLLLGELMEFYATGSGGSETAPPQYLDFAQRQLDTLNSSEMRRQATYWHQELAGELPTLDWAIGRPRPATISYRGGRVDIALGRERSRAVRDFASAEHATPFMVTLAAYYVWLWRHTTNDEFIVSLPISNRNRPELERMVGPLSNNLLLRVRVSPEQSFRQLVRQVRSKVLAAFDNQDYPYDKLVDDLSPPRDLSRNPLFDTMFWIGSSASSTANDADGDVGTSVEHRSARLDATIELAMQDEELRGYLEYRSDLFSADMAHRMARRYSMLTGAACTTPELPLTQLEWLPPEELTELSMPIGSLDEPTASDTLIDWIERSAAKWAPREALSESGRTVTYEALMHRVGQVESGLEQYCGRGDRIVCAMDRSIDLVAAFIAIMRRGGVIVAVDVSQPRERIKSIVEQCNPACCLVDASSEQLLEGIPTPHVNVSTLVASPPVGSIPRVLPQDPAFVIFTSGSTGQPKGIVCSHRAIVHRIRWFVDAFGYKENERAVLTTSPAFVDAFTELFTPLVSGVPASIADLSTASDPGRLAECVVQQKITRLVAVPSMLRAMAVEQGLKQCTSLRVIISSGEALDVDLAQSIRSNLPNTRLVNLYGSTEVMGDVTYHEVTDDSHTERGIPLGYVVPGHRVFVLDDELAPVGVGLVGNLWVAGPQLALGYFQDTRRTSERFVPTPDGASDRMYATGDRCVRAVDGLLYYAGRQDRQVKLRGNRVELGDVEAKVRAHPLVRDAAAMLIAQKSGAELIVVVEPIGEASADLDAVVIGYARTQLPRYMVPNRVVVMRQLPRTVSGKLDRRAVEATDHQRLAAASHVPPRTEIEKILFSLWRDVLGRSEFGVTDDFFGLGGHSLLVTQIANRIRTTLGVELQLPQLFRATTIEALAQLVSRGTSEADSQPIPKLATRVAPLSLAQERLWFLQKFSPETGAYNIAIAALLVGDCNVEVFTAAEADIVARHEALRVTVREQTGGPVQALSEGPAPQLKVRQLKNGESSDDIAKQYAARPFDLERGPLWRSVLIQEADDRHVYVLVMHHIIGDGWSLRVLSRDLTECYAKRLMGDETPLLKLPLQYLDYAAWERQQETSNELARFTERLGNAPLLLDLPTDHPRPAVERHHGDRVSMRIPSAIVERANRIAQTNDTTLFMVLVGVYQAFLCRYCRQADVLVGVPNANRVRAEFENVVGMFVNTLVLRGHCEQDTTLETMLSAVRTDVLSAYAEQSIPFEQIVQALQPKRDRSRAPIFQTMFNFQSAQPSGGANPGLDAQVRFPSTSWSRFDLSLDLSTSGDEVIGSVEYAVDLFDAVTVEMMMRHYVALLDSATRRPDLPLLRLEMLDPLEVQIATAGAVPAAEGDSRLFMEMFRDQVAAHPDRKAVLGAEVMTYGQLSTRAEHIAERLRGLGVGPGKVVALAVHRNTDAVAILLGVLVSGGAYLPLDPSYPTARLQFMAEDCNVSVLVADQDIANRLKLDGPVTVTLDALVGSVEGDNFTSPTKSPSPLSTAYIIYTSGSTGLPKGVVVQHDTLATSLRSLAKSPGMSRDEVVAGLTSLSFDPHCLEILLPLTLGACVAIIDEQTAADVSLLGQALRDHAVTLLQGTPSRWRMLLEAGEIERGVRGLIGAEPLTSSLAKQLIEAGVVLSNIFGLTENTIWASVAPIEDPSVITLGQPLEAYSMYVLDDELQPTPQGVLGELYIGGAGIARGYQGRPALTAERFVPDPYGAPGARLLRTRDLVRRTRDGCVFVGRLDHQVKVRGFRVELGEIEAVLGAIDGVGPCVVTAYEADGETNLVAYYVMRGDGPESQIDGVRAELRKQLPQFMVPSVLMPLDQLPRNPNGKIDRKALPPPTPIATSSQVVLPRGELETQLLAIWKDALGGAEFGVTDNFFDVGGHSLIATRILNQIRQQLGRSVPLRLFFEQPTVEGLALETSMLTADGTDTPLYPVKSGPVPLSVSQERVWFLEQLEPGTAAWHLAGGVELLGELDLAALREALAQLVERQGALRTKILHDDGVARQELTRAHANLPCTDSACGDAPWTTNQVVVDALAKLVRRPFDLAAGSLYRTELYRLAPNRHLLVLVIHHIVSDGRSIMVFIRELLVLYEAARGAESPLPTLPIQYRDYADWQRRMLDGEATKEGLDFWRRLVLHPPPLLTLPYDRPRPQVPSTRGGRCTFRWSAELGKRVDSLARETGTTAFMVISSALFCLLHRYSGETDIALGTPVTNRQRPELEHLIGFLVSTIILRPELKETSTFRELLASVRATCLDAFSHQDVPFEQLLMEQKDRSSVRAPAFQVMLTLQVAQEQVLDGLGALKVVPIRMPSTDSAKFDLAFFLDAFGSEYVGSLEYCVDMFDEKTIERMLGHFEALLSEVSTAPDRPLHSYNFIGADESDFIQRSEAGEAIAAPVDGLAAMSAIALREPGRIALIGDDTLTYGAFLERVSGVRDQLRENGIGRGSTVGVHLPRSAAQIVAVWGVLATGAGYLPLPTDHPPERLAQIIADAKPALILSTNTGTIGEAPVVAVTRKIGVVDSLKWTGGPTGPAYMIYTSGSTGQPKGAIVPGHALWSYASAARQLYEIEPSDVVLQFATLAFDASIEEIFPALSVGARLVLRSEDMLTTAAAFVSFCTQHAITFATLPTGYWHQLVDALEGEGVELPESLRMVVLGGEKAHGHAVRRWRARWPKIRLVNTYGPTEGIVVATGANLSDWQGESADIDPPIGTPIPGARAFVLDQNLHRVPLGCVGQLHLGAPRLATGYHARPKQTASAFVPDPFAPGMPGSRLYCTGDLVTRGTDGSLRFVGRRDGQAKIRGFRVELGEIEAHMVEHEWVRQCVCVVDVHADGNTIAAYVVMHQSAAAQPWPSLKAFLRERLPAYMMPSVWFRLDELPLNASGKVDRKRLPKDAVRDSSVVAPTLDRPRNPTEEMLVSLWAELLRQGDPGIHQSFFELGGHSLLAIRLLSRVRQTFGLDLQLRALFMAPTIAHLAEMIDQGRHLVDGVRPEIRGAALKELALSFDEQRLWFLHTLDLQTAAYVIPVAVTLTGPLRIEAVKGSLEALVDRHDVLRTNVALDGDDRPFPVLNATVELPFRLTDLSELDAIDREAQLDQGLFSLAHQTFDLSVAPAFRVELFRLDAEQHVMAIAVDHIFCDGWSISNLVRDFCVFYEAFVHGTRPLLPELPFSFRDFASYQRKRLQGERLANSLQGWRDAMLDIPTTLDLPTDYRRPAMQTFQGGRSPMTLSTETVELADALAKRTGTTRFMLMLAVAEIVFWRWTGQERFALGTPAANRSVTGTEELVGLFVNTLPIPAVVEPDASFEEFVKGVKKRCLSAYSYQEVPFEKIVEAIAPDRKLDRPPLFQVMVALQKEPMSGRLGQHLEVRHRPMTRVTSMFELTIELFEQAGSLDGHIEYNTDLFRADTISAVAQWLVSVFERAVREPGLPVRDFELLAPASAVSIVNLPSDQALDRVDVMVASQVERTPNAPAVVFGDGMLTYRDLDRWSRRVESLLRALELPREFVVGVCMDKGPQLLPSLLGVLRAGLAFVPLDPKVPLARRCHMLADAGSNVALVDAASLPEFSDRTFRVVQVTDEESLPLPLEALPSKGTLDDLMYVMYTSGSTGAPKGVSVPHGPISDHLAWMRDKFNIGADDRALQLTSIGFDVSIWELFGPLICGGCVVMPTGQTGYDPLAVVAELTGQRITLMQSVPALLSALCDLPEFGQCETLRHVFCGGEAMPHRLVARFAESTHATLHNMYGPTECGIDAAFFTLDSDQDGRANVPIGDPVGARRLYVLGSTGEPLPLGAVGELYVGGTGPVRGYRGAPGLTAAAFVPDPHVDEPGARMYRTGDRARRRWDGRIEVRGRTDSQVKVGGVRIELAEVEAALCALPEVVEAVCSTLVRSMTTQLIAWIVPASDDIDTANLQRRLQETLPRAMVPSRIYLRAEFPQTSTGKVDRPRLKASLDPNIEETEQGEVASAPTGPGGVELVEELQRVLGRNDLPINASFFELGGDSVMAVQLCAGLRRRGFALLVRDVFETTSWPHLARRLRIAEIASPTDNAKDEGSSLPLTPMQHWFFDLALPNPGHWAQCAVVRIPPSLGASLEGVLRLVVMRHPALRSRFVQTDGRWEQLIQSDAAVSVESLSLDDPGQISDAIAACHQLAAKLSLDKSAIAVGHARSDTGTFLLLALHHAVCDDVSLRIVLEDLEYAARTGGLPPGGSQREWVEHLVALGSSEAVQNNLSAWLVELSEALSSQSAPSESRGGLSSVEAVLDEDLSATLEAGRPRLGGFTPLAVATLSLHQAYSEVFGTKQLGLLLDVVGRPPLFDDVDSSRLVGWLSAQCPLVTHADMSLSPVARVSRIAAQIEALPLGGLGYSIARYLLPATSAGKLARAFRPPRVALNFLGTADRRRGRTITQDLNCFTSVGADNHEHYAGKSAVDLDVTIAVGEKTTMVRFDYRPDIYAVEEMQKLSKSFAQHIQQVCDAFG